MSEDTEFSMALTHTGTIIYADTFTPIDSELRDNHHIIMSSPHPWDPTNVEFSNNSRSLEEEITEVRGVNAIETRCHTPHIYDAGIFNHIIIGSTQSHDRTINGIKIRRKISDVKINVPPQDIITKSNLDIGKTDILRPNTFQSTKRHTDVSPEDLSERWCISIPQAIRTLKKTSQKFLRSALLPLSRRYRADRMFQRKTLVGHWSTDTLDGGNKSLDGNKCAQVFANKGYFAKIYPMDSKSKCGDALKIFCREFGVPERLIFDGSKEQTKKNTTFMK